MQFYVHFMPDRTDPIPPLTAMRQFEGDTPMDALKAALNAMPPPVENDGEQLWARIVVEVENGRAKRALMIPLVREGTVPVELWLPKGGGL
jgi:hypothetical protein